MTEAKFDDYRNLKANLDEALAECQRLREENARLKLRLGLTPETISQVAGQMFTDNIEQVQEADTNINVTKYSAPEKKISLFRSLFRGREDVYPVRWEGKAGKRGYSPACANEWRDGYCQKPRVKCSRCSNRYFLPVTNELIQKHLTGKCTIGVYPLLPDETCCFLAVDLDKQNWPDDARAFLDTCDQLGVPAAMERSRSGNGAHIWLFFDEPVPAAKARALGSYILTQTMEIRPELGFDSYDRFFPNQDTMPRGGFGNLIALPLQYKPRQKGNSVFVNHQYRAYDDQWAYLASIKKIDSTTLDLILKEAYKANGIIGIARVSCDDADRDPWTVSSSNNISREHITGLLPPAVKIVYSNQLYIHKDDLPPAIINRIIRLAAFQNPEFYKAQSMRLPTYDKPRVIACAEDYPRHIGLPRGCLDEVLELLNAHNVQVNIIDERCTGADLEVDFTGVLNSLQQEAKTRLMAHDLGILSASTAFGKTVVAAAMIAERKTSTLILVHRRQLMDQWKERLGTFLNIPRKCIGTIGGGKENLTGQIDIAMIQSLGKKGIIKDLVTDYGQVIIDECHHLSAFSFEQVLKQVKAKYVLGLTATPIRKDGHHPIIIMQCGPIRFRVNDRQQAAIMPFDHVVIPRTTQFILPDNCDASIMHEVYAALAVDEGRNDLILDDILHALDEGRSPILLTERIGHLEYFAQRLEGFAKNIIVLRGGMGKKQRHALADKITSIPDNEERVLLATGRYIGEGFDDARLDTLFLVMPISWKGTLQQYAGRLHRLHHNKHEVQIYDYLDINVPLLNRMYNKRLQGYRNMGYEIRVTT